MCDCRITWIKMLRNETKSEILQAALDDVTCVPKQLSLKDNEDDVSKSNIFEVITDSNTQQDSNDEFYEETNQLYKLDATVQPVTAPQVNVVKVLPNSLACPSELTHKEDSLMLSSKDESYWLPGSSCSKFSSLFLIFSLVLVCLSL